MPNVKKLHEKEKSIEAEIQRLETLVANNSEENKIEDIQVLKEELRTIRETTLRGNMLRAKAQKYIHFGKPTKYFCNLEKQNYTSKVVNKVRTSNGIITNQQTILKELIFFIKTSFRVNTKIIRTKVNLHFWSKKILNPSVCRSKQNAKA